jgi:hypothetical protein
MNQAEAQSLDLHTKRTRIVQAMDRLKKINGARLYEGALVRDMEEDGREEVFRKFPVKMRVPTDSVPRDGWVYDTQKE